MTAPLQVLTTETGVSVRPMTVSLEELAEAIKPWVTAQAEVDQLWHNRHGSGPDLSEAENRAQAAADDVLKLLTTPLTPQQARDVSDLLVAASLAVGNAVKAG